MIARFYKRFGRQPVITRYDDMIGGRLGVRGTRASVTTIYRSWHDHCETLAEIQRDYPVLSIADLAKAVEWATGHIDDLEEEEQREQGYRRLIRGLEEAGDD
jgi:uncharacterized protein (DUF433 family)